MTRICYTSLGQGDWTASLLDKATGAELPLERTGWTGSAGRVESDVSQANVILDPEYADYLCRRPILWSNEILLLRDNQVAWVGPVTSIQDDPDEGVTWVAQDRMAYVMFRRWFWRSANYVGDQAALMTMALDAADYGDPTGLQRQPIPTGAIVDMPVVAGDKVGDAIDDLGVRWSVIADTVRYGALDVDAEQILPADAWGDERPTITADGYERLSHVAAVTTNNGRAFYPSADPNDRPPGTPLLVDTIDVGDVSLGAARELARQAWLDRQGELFIVADTRAPLGADFPLQWTELQPGAVLYSSARGRQLVTEQSPVRLSTATAEIRDGRESSVLGTVTEVGGTWQGSDPYVHDLGRLPGVTFPPGETYPLDQLDGIDWPGLGLVADDQFNIGLNAGPDPLFDPIDGIGDPGFPLLDGVDAALVDPYADCPPSHCCDLCGGGGPGGGGGGVAEQALGTQDYHDLKLQPIRFTYEQYGVPPDYVAGDLLISQLQGDSGTSLSFDAGSGWTEHLNGVHDAATVVVATATDPSSFDLVWPETAELGSVDGQICVVSGGGTVNAFSFKNSDVDGFSGDSALPQVTTSVDGCIIVYGIIGSGNEIGDVEVLPTLRRLSFNQFGQFCVFYWERQTSAGLTTARTVTYPAGEFRTEWVIAIAP